MAFFEWNQSRFSVGVDSMDGQHQILIRIINQIYDASKKSPQQPQPNQALFKELIEFTVKHFGEEENVMKNIGYPDLDAHQVIHKNLVKKVLRFKSDFDKNDSQFSEQFLNFLKMWLISHIEGIDKRYGSHANQMKN